MVVAGLAAITGFLASIVALLAYLREVRRDRPRLRVIPRIGRVGAGSDGRPIVLSAATLTPGVDWSKCFLGVEIVNLSAFPVTVDQIGLGSPDQESGRPVVTSTLPFGDSIPRNLGSRESMTIWTSDCFPADQISTFRVYAETACGVVEYGTNEVLREYVTRTWEQMRRRNRFADGV